LHAAKARNAAAVRVSFFIVDPAGWK